MSNLGMGVMLGILGGSESTVAAIRGSIGRTLASVKLSDERLVIDFVDGGTLALKDGGQSCCEYWYLTCDDDLPWFAGRGAKLVSVETREAAEGEAPDSNEDNAHDVAFLVVTTDKGAITVCTHNEHNGYYGGFWIEAELSTERTR